MTANCDLQQGNGPSRDWLPACDLIILKKSRQKTLRIPPASDAGSRLGHDFFAQTTRQVAQQLLGKRLVRISPKGERLSGIVVEVEAYLSQADLASHSYRGPSNKNASMFLESGRLYVYSIHAKHCLNVVTEPAGRGAAVLIRALQPLEGLATMVRMRGLHTDQPAADIDLRTAIATTAGPARLCQALAVDRSYDGLDLVSSQQLWLEAVPELSRLARNIRRGPRIGISQSQGLPLRYFLDGHHFVSGLARQHSRGRHWAFAATS